MHIHCDCNNVAQEQQRISDACQQVIPTAEILQKLNATIADENLLTHSVYDEAKLGAKPTFTIVSENPLIMEIEIATKPISCRVNRSLETRARLQPVISMRTEFNPGAQSNKLTVRFGSKVDGGEVDPASQISISKVLPFSAANSINNLQNAIFSLTRVGWATAIKIGVLQAVLRANDIQFTEPNFDAKGYYTKDGAVINFTVNGANSSTCEIRVPVTDSPFALTNIKVGRYQGSDVQQLHINDGDFVGRLVRLLDKNGLLKPEVDED